MDTKLREILRIRGTGVLSGALLGFFTLGQVLTASGQTSSAPEFLTPAPESKSAGVAPHNGSSIVRQHFATIQTSVLEGVKTQGSGSLKLSLFHDYAPQVTFDKVQQYGADRYALVGRVEGQPLSKVYLARNKGAVSASVHTGEGDVYSIRPRGKGLHEVVQVSAAKLKPVSFLDPGAVGEAAAAGAKLAAAEPAIAGDDGSYIDIFFLYTQSCLDYAGEHDSVVAIVDETITATNDVFAASNVITQVKNIHTTFTEDSESSSISDDLNALRRDKDGKFDEVHKFRDDFKADIVMLATGFLSDECGAAYLLKNVDDPRADQNGFGSFVLECIGDYAMTRSLGSTLGCAKARPEALEPGLFPYSFGHRWQGNSGQTWKSMMAEDPGVRAPHFSNPEVDYDGVPTGIAEGKEDEADNAKTINESCFYVANFRTGGSTENPEIGLDQNSIVIDTEIGVNPDPITLTITNTKSGFLKYTVSNVATWMTVTPVEGLAISKPTGEKGSVTHTIVFNTSTLPSGNYADSVRVTALDAAPAVVPVLVRIKAPCGYAISPGSTILGANGGNSAFNITTNGSAECNWSVTTNVSWITLATSSGSGPAAIGFSVAANPGYNFRTGSIRVAGRTFMVRQAGKSTGSELGAMTGFESLQRTAVHSAGGQAYQEITYNYSTQALSLSPYRTVNSSVSYDLMPDQWIGIFHYDYTAGRYTQSVYRTKLLVP